MSDIVLHPLFGAIAFALVLGAMWLGWPARRAANDNEQAGRPVVAGWSAKLIGGVGLIGAAALAMDQNYTGFVATYWELLFRAAVGVVTCIVLVKLVGKQPRNK